MYRTILVPTDGSDGSMAAVEHAVDLAAAFDAAVHALYVVDQTYPAVSKYDFVTEDEEETGVAVERHLRRGVPHEEILAAVDDYGADLVVMGTHGRTGLDRVAHAGSTTERVVRLAAVPVLTVDIGDVAPETG
jgi:nucleotide-binding universal stress UspA family protein